jgi:acyl-CoA reductase-like NAD-dependent aldehyde dehydrogenase
MDLEQNFIDGRFEDSGGSDRIEVLSPARDNVISAIPDSPASVVDQAVASAKRAQADWEKLPAIKRAGYLRQISAKIRANADQIARVIFEEQGDRGPIINRAGVEKIKGLVDGALAQGAEPVVGGKVADLGAGNHHEPTVLANCRQDMDIVQKAVFGPALPVVAFGDLDEAIAYASDTVYGLTSSIDTNDIGTALRACDELHFGQTYVNRENFEAMQGFHAGHGRSGIGGAAGKHGLYECTQTHVAYIQT